VKANEFLGAFLAKYLELISLEQAYFKKQFKAEEDFTQKFEVFRRENEYDMLVKRIRPWIVGCVEIEELCRCIDIFSQYSNQAPSADAQPSSFDDAQIELRVQRQDSEAPDLDSGADLESG